MTSSPFLQIANYFNCIIKHINLDLTFSFSLISSFTLITILTAVFCIKTTKISPPPIHRPPIGYSAHRSLTNCIFQSLQRLLFFFLPEAVASTSKRGSIKTFKRSNWPPHRFSHCSFFLAGFDSPLRCFTSKRIFEHDSGFYLGFTVNLVSKSLRMMKGKKVHFLL